jgi:uncharacterized GH25 family protein
MCLLAAEGLAHQFWIEPSTFRPKTKNRVTVTLRVGDGFPGEEYERYASHFRTFEHVSGDRRVPVPGTLYESPAGFFIVREAALSTVSYVSENSSVALKGEKFNSYLVTEGLEKVLEDRRESGTDADDVIELYSRCCKSLIQTGPATEQGPPTLGHELEIVTTRNPFLVRPRETIEGQALHHGRPHANALVRVFHPDEEAAHVLAVRTDDAGRFSFQPDRPGLWMLSVVKIEPVESAEADWRSIWASLTFEIPVVP